MKHIHGEGMIHRDIKPVNVFLDANDHVKIGDFGLATAGILEEMREEEALDVNNASSALIGSSQTTGLTTKIGTALYAAPELLTDSVPIDVSRSGHRYTHLVDIYSTGVVLFEMFYRPLPLGMERIGIITKLRDRTGAVLPGDFGDDLSTRNKERVKSVVCWMLNPDPGQRPSAEQLLDSPLLPPMEMHELEFRKAFQGALCSGPQSRTHKWIFNEIFANDRYPSSAQDYCYDTNFSTIQEEFSMGKQLISEEVEKRLSKIFRRHSAVRLASPMLIPKNRQVVETASNRQNEVTLADRNGLLLSLPFDSRFGFARFVARHQISRLKRFAFDAVYREQGAGCCPRELTDCAIDVVTCSSQTGTTASAEIFAVLEEVILEFPVLRQREFTLRLNHTDLVRAVCFHTGVTSEECQRKLLSVLEEEWRLRLLDRDKNLQSRSKKWAESLNVSEQTAGVLMSLLDSCDRVGRVSSQLRGVIRKKNSETAAQLAKEALGELERIRLSCENLGLVLEPLVSLGMVYRPSEYSGLMFQLEWEAEPRRRKQKKTTEKEIVVLAAGGRYDDLVESFRRPGLQPPLQGPIAGPVVAVGASIAFDKIVTMTIEQRRNEWSALDTGSDVAEVLVCSVGGEKNLLKEKLSLLRELWAADISADYLQDPVGSLQDLQDHCKAVGIRNLIVLKDPAGCVLWKCCDSYGKFSDRKVARQEVCSCVLGWKQDLVAEKLRCEEKLTAGENVLVKQASNLDLNSGKETRSDSFPVSSGSQSASLSKLKITFLEKIMAHHARKRLISHIESQVQHLVQNFSPKVTVDLIATDLPAAVVKSVANGLDTGSSETGFRKSGALVLNQWNKYKRQLSLLVDLLVDIIFENSSTERKPGSAICDKAVVIFSYADDMYRVMLPW